MQPIGSPLSGYSRIEDHAVAPKHTASAVIGARLRTARAPRPTIKHVGEEVGLVGVLGVDLAVRQVQEPDPHQEGGHERIDDARVERTDA